MRQRAETLHQHLKNANENESKSAQMHHEHCAQHARLECVVENIEALVRHLQQDLSQLAYQNNSLIRIIL